MSNAGSKKEHERHYKSTLKGKITHAVVLFQPAVRHTSYSLVTRAQNVALAF